jgi:hypothetical protein
VPAAGGDRGRPRLLREGRDDERAAGGLVEHRAGLVLRAGVELHEQVGDDLVALVGVKADVGEELLRPRVAERRVGERLAGLGARARLDVVRRDGHGAGGDPRRAHHEALPAGLVGLQAPVDEEEVRLVVHAVQALHDGLLLLLDGVHRRAGGGVDAVDPVVVDVELQRRRPAAIAPHPGQRAGLRHAVIVRRRGTDVGAAAEGRAPGVVRGSLPACAADS